MKIFLEDASKRFVKQRIFHQVNLQFSAPHNYAILGENGSGKSTLLRSLAGMQQLSLGKLTYELKGKKIAPEQVFKYVSYCAPGLELIEEMKLKELIAFHFQFVPPAANKSVDFILQTTGLQPHAQKLVEELSSGMKQRVKLALAIFTQRPVLLLDEPCSNLDAAGMAQYYEWMTHTTDKLVIIASNDPKEYSICKHHLNMASLK